MLLKAQDIYNIDLTKSYMIGDHERDTQAGLAAGCVAIKIDARDPKYSTLLKCVSEII
jgi:D-glycero-D-manno-heptose 1,7-bisphosphate phosphatase